MARGLLLEWKGYLGSPHNDQQLKPSPQIDHWSCLLSISHPQDRLRHLQVIDAACARLADLFRRRSCLTKKSQLYEICHGSTSPIQFVFIIHQGAAPPLIVTNHMITSNHICTNNWRTTKTHNILCKLKTLTPN